MSGPWRLALGGLITLASAMGIGRFVFTPILPPMQAGIGLGAAEAGFVAAANFAGYLAGALLAAAPLPYGRRAWLLSALAASAATTAGMGWASTVTAFLGLRFAGGVASAFAFVFGAGIVIDRLVAAGRPRLVAVYFAGVGTGIAGSALLVSVLTAHGVDWRDLWFACGVASTIALALVAWLVPGDAGGDGPGTAASRPVPPVVGRGPGATLVLSYGLFGFGYVITMTFLVAIVRADPGLRPLEPYAWVVVGLAAAPSVAFWNGIARRLGTLRTYAAAALSEAAGVAASVLWPTGAGVVLSGILVGGTFVGLTALGLAAARERAVGDARRTIAGMTASFGAGQIVGPAFAGLAAERFGGFLVPSLAAVAALLVAASLALVIDRRR